MSCKEKSKLNKAKYRKDAINVTLRYWVNWVLKAIFMWESKSNKTEVFLTGRSLIKALSICLGRKLAFSQL